MIPALRRRLTPIIGRRRRGNAPTIIAIVAAGTRNQAEDQQQCQ
ncbi:MAG: hypothetical protein OXF04_10735 [bacterium]|nr:hypothetical protein [bacterium]